MCGKKYDKLRAQYPEYISKDQLYRICGISKLSAAYLIQNGIIPVIDTGKKTWRYKIALEDVITYLETRSKKGSMIPKGAATSKSHKNPKITYSSVVGNENGKQLKEYFSYIYEDYPDALKPSDIAEMTGLSIYVIRTLLRRGAIKSIKSSNCYIIPKEYALDYVSSPIFIEAKSNSEDFKRILGGFIIWINAKL